MHTYFKKGSHSPRWKNDLLVNRAKITTLGEKSLRTSGPKIWNSPPESIKDIISLQKFTESKLSTDLNANAKSEKTRVIHITILKLHILAWICPNWNLIPNINKQNIKRNKIVIFWRVYSWFLVCTHSLGFIFIFIFWCRIAFVQ